VEIRLGSLSRKEEQDVSWPGFRNMLALLGLSGWNTNDAAVNDELLNVKPSGANDISSPRRVTKLFSSELFCFFTGPVV